MVRLKNNQFELIAFLKIHFWYENKSAQILFIQQTLFIFCYLTLIISYFSQ